MPVVQTHYGRPQQSNTPMTVWLTVDVPGRAFDKVEELEKVLGERAREWVREAEQGVVATSNYDVETGFAETKKLMISVSVR